MKRLTWKGFLQSLLETVKSTSMLLIIIVGAMIFGYFLTIAGVSHFIASTATELIADKWAFYAAIIFTYFVLGCIMDSIAMMLVTVPIFYP